MLTRIRYLGMKMIVALLMSGMVVGALAGGAHIVAGGSVLTALLIYSLGATAAVLLASALAYSYSLVRERHAYDSGPFEPKRGQILARN